MLTACRRKCSRGSPLPLPSESSANDRSPIRSSVKIVFCWTGPSGYAGACWRALDALPGHRVHVFCHPQATRNAETAFDDGILRDLSHEFITPERMADDRFMADCVSEQKPDVVFLAGWTMPSFLKLPAMRSLRDAKFVLCMDTPFRNDIRQILGRFYLASALRRLSAAFVPGDRAAVYARSLGFRPDAIYRGLYGYDEQIFNERTFASRLSAKTGWPRRFIFVGRFVHAKGIDTLVEAYKRYRSMVPDPWSLSCAGLGHLGEMLKNVEGIQDLGFVQPVDQPAMYAAHGAFLLPSRYEPWGVVLAEAMSTGLPAITTNACGAAADLVRPFVNGLEVPPDSPVRLASAMHWIHTHADGLPAMGEAAMWHAKPFAAHIWAQKVAAISADIV
jgi:glycosyltransferase involved in cell wall biosynthesis